MSDDERDIVSHEVKVGGRTFGVRIPADECDLYDDMAAFINEIQSDLREQGLGKDHGTLWAMTAFQIATELFDARSRLDRIEADNQRVKSVVERMRKSRGDA